MIFAGIPYAAAGTLKKYLATGGMPFCCQRVDDATFSRR